jgi:hypothetical protein
MPLLPMVKRKANNGSTFPFNFSGDYPIKSDEPIVGLRGLGGFERTPDQDA